MLGGGEVTSPEQSGRWGHLPQPPALCRATGGNIGVIATLMRMYERLAHI